MTQETPRKLLICLSYYQGDIDSITQLANLIADLEATRNTKADILLYRRNDAPLLDDMVKMKLSSKFDKVHVLKCRRMNATGYPCGPNNMFYDLVEQMRRPEWSKLYWGFLNLESDCCPTRPGWIDVLIQEYLNAHNQGKCIIGHVNQAPVLHLNGVALYAIDLFHRAGGMDLLGGPEDIAYDFYHAKRFLPLSQDTGLILLDFNRKTVTANDLFSIRKGEVKPVLFHGVKDGSSMAAVRARYIDKGNPVDLSNKTVFTYFSSSDKEDGALLEAWKRAWSIAGWNPVVLNGYDARKHSRYNDAQAAVEEKDKAELNKLLALAYYGGGLYTDITIFPSTEFTPEKLADYNTSPVCSFQNKITVGRKKFVTTNFIYINKSSIDEAINEIVDSKSKKEISSVFSGAIANPICKDIGANGWKEAKAVVISDSACALYSPGSPKKYVANKYIERLTLL